MSEQKWLRSSLRNLSVRLGQEGHPASPPTVGRLLRKLGYALHVNAKKIEASYENGILEVHVPKAKEAVPTKVEIKVK